MSGDNRIGINAVHGVIRASAARRLSADDTAATRAAPPVQSPYDSAPTGGIIGMARAMADQGPPVDMDRIDALKSAIADGSYTADPAKIASSMMRFFGRGD